MSALRRLRRLAAGFALLAMLAFALMPTLARAWAMAQGGSGWGEVCTAQGPSWASPDGERRGKPTDGAARHLDACHFCQLATEGAAPLAGLAPVATRPQATSGPAHLRRQALPAQPGWRTGQPRAPPGTA